MATMPSYNYSYQSLYNVLMIKGKQLVCSFLLYCSEGVDVILLSCD